MRACACGLRTKAAYSWPGRTMSSVYRPCPLMNRASSLRLGLEPMPEPFGVTMVVMSEPSIARGAGHRLRGVLHGANDVVIAGTAAHVALDGVTNVRLARIRVARQQINRTDDHAGRTESALEPVLLPEALLHRVHRA